jgi:hypothetical protein
VFALGWVGIFAAVVMAPFVAALIAAFSDIEGRVSDIDARVAALEAAQSSLSTDVPRKDPARLRKE